MATPAKFSVADRKKPTPWDGLVVAAVLLLAFFCALLLQPARADAPGTVTICQGDQTVYTCDLAKLTEAVSLPVDGPYPLLVTLSPDSVRVSEHSCPDGDCARTVLEAGASGQLICLPNQTIIQLDCGPFSFDAVTG